MRFDLVVNTFVKDALLQGRLILHGGGWMWRPLVDVQDVSDAMIATLEAPDDLVRGEIFNVLHSNYQIRELAMLVAGSVQLARAHASSSPRRRRRRARATTSARTRSSRNASASFRSARSSRPSPTCSSASTSRTARTSATRATTTSAGSSCCTSCALASRRSAQCCELRPRPDHRGGRTALERPRGGARRTRRGDGASRRPSWTSPTTRRSTSRHGSAASTSSSTAPRSTTSTRASGRRTRAFEVNARAVKRLAERCGDGAVSSTSAPTTSSTASGTSRTARTTSHGRSTSTAISKLAGEHAALAYCDAALVVRTAGLYGRHGSASKGGNFVVRMIARAREQGALQVVADQRLTPTYTGDLAAAIVDAVARGATASST